MNIQVLSYAEVTSCTIDQSHILIRLGKKDILHPLPPNTHCLAELCLEVDDVVVAQEGYTHFTIHHALQIKEFLQQFSEYELQYIDVYIHCLMGQSRSAGVAAALHYIYNDDDSIIFQNHKYTPNVLIYRKILEIYGYSNIQTVQDRLLHRI